MKTIIFILLAVFAIQVVINVILIYHHKKPYTIRELFQKLFDTHWIIWIPVIGFIVQVFCGICAVTEQIWKIIKMILNAVLNIRIRLQTIY